MFLVRRVRLNNICEAGDQCMDLNAVCRNGACSCQAGYYDNQERCGRFVLKLFMFQEFQI